KQGLGLSEGFLENSSNHIYAFKVTKICEAIEEKAI
ncbi:hypothetical protein LCGC14_1275400, partial [marine sediment metagenome]